MFLQRNPNKSSNDIVTEDEPGEQSQVVDIHDEIIPKECRKKRKSSRIKTKQKQDICDDDNEDSEEQNTDLAISNIENSKVFVQEQLTHCIIIIIYVCQTDKMV